MNWNVIPTKREWGRWSKPAKLTALGTLCGIASLLLSWFLSGGPSNAPTTSVAQVAQHANSIVNINAPVIAGEQGVIIGESPAKRAAETPNMNSAPTVTNEERTPEKFRLSPDFPPFPEGFDRIKPGMRLSEAIVLAPGGRISVSGYSLDIVHDQFQAVSFNCGEPESDPQVSEIQFFFRSDAARRTVIAEILAEFGSLEHRSESLGARLAWDDVGGFCLTIDNQYRIAAVREMPRSDPIQDEDDGTESDDGQGGSNGGIKMEATIDASLLKGESQAVEHKRSLAEQREGLEDLCSMVNADPGFGALIFGVDPSGKIVGVEPGNLDRAQQTLARTVQDKFQPRLQATAEVFEVDNKRLVVIKAQRSREVAYHEFDGRAYIREGTVTRQLDLSEKQSLQRKRNRDQHAGPWRCDQCGKWVGMLMSVEITDDGPRKSYRCDCGGEYWPSE